MTDDGFVSFGYKCRWLTVRSENIDTVADAVFLKNRRPCSWAEGIEAAYGAKLFISPPVDGWTFVVGNCLPDSGGPDGPEWSPDRCTPLLVHLSQLFGEAQYFATHRVVEYHAWARACAGRMVRAYAFLGEQGITIWDRGDLTQEEASLGFTPHSESMPADEAVNAEVVPDEDFVMRMAGKWSLDPQTLESRGPAASKGLVGDFGPTFYKLDLRKVAYGELWRMLSWRVALYAYLMKALGITIDSRSYGPEPDALLVVDYDYLPDYAKRAMDPYVRFAESLAPRFKIVEVGLTIDAVEGCGVHFLNGEGTTAALIPYSRCQYMFPPTEKSYIVFATPIDGDELLATSSDRSGFRSRPGVHLEVTHSSAERTYARHVERLDANQSRIRPVARTEAEFRAFLRQLVIADLQDKIQRGLYVEMSQDEVNRIRGMV